MPEPNWLKIAYSQIGQKEIKGGKHNPSIIEYHSTTTLKATEDEIPWCSSFVNWCFVKDGLEGSNSARAKDWMKWGKHIEKPYVGCVAVFEHHVGFFLGLSGSNITILGGNQDDRVCIMNWRDRTFLGYRAPGSKLPN
jgi:uncharacterized protein (TIGR02594 family)